MSLGKRAGAELLGTFWLVFGGCGSAVIAADGRARHEAVVHALDLLRGSGIAKVAIVVRRP